MEKLCEENKTQQKAAEDGENESIKKLKKKLIKRWIKKNKI